MYKEVSDLKDFIKKWCGYNVPIYIPNGGFIEEAIEAHGTYDFFKKNKMKFYMGDINQRYNNQYIILGSGRLNENTKKFVEQNRNNHLLLLPQKIENYPRFLYRCPMIILCSDRLSYDYATSCVQEKYTKEIYLHMDMAFYITNRLQRIEAIRDTVCLNQDALNQRRLMSENCMRDEKNVSQALDSICGLIAVYKKITTDLMPVAALAKVMNKEIDFTATSSHDAAAANEFLKPSRLFKPIQPLYRNLFKEGIIDAVLYINLAHRTDRRKQIESLLDTYEVPRDKIHRINAIQFKNGHKGCAASHMAAMDYARERGFSRVLVLEDDFEIYRTFPVANFYRRLDEVMKHPFDIIMLAGNIRDARDTKHPNLQKAIRVSTSSAYLINSHFYATLKRIIKITYDRCHETVHKKGVALDQGWFKHQSKHNWFITLPRIGKQRFGESDTDHKVHMRRW